MLKKLKPKIKHYVSEADHFLKTFDCCNPELSTSQKEEVAKHASIAHLRDHADASDDQNSVWEDF